MPLNKITFRQKLFSILFGVFLFVLLLEIALRIGGFLFLFLQEQKNMLSIRQKCEYRILCLGESTTALGGKDSYPSLLERILNSGNTGLKFSVINGGIPAIDSSGVVSQLESNLNKYNPDLVITMIGINDRGGNISHIPKSKSRSYFKTFKLVRLLYSHIKSRLREIDIEGVRKKESIVLRSHNLYQSKQSKKVSISERDVEVKPNNDNRLSETEEIYRKDIERNPEDDMAYAKLGWFLHNHLGDFEGAIKMCQKAIEINPRNVEAHTTLGEVYTTIEKYEDAIKVYTKSIEIAPRGDLTYFLLGKLYVKKGDLEKAKAMFLKAIEINPRNDRWYGGLAFCYEALGEKDLSEKFFTKANELRAEYYNSLTFDNYHKLKEILSKKGIKLICVQYPMRSIEPLRNIFKLDQDVITFVDNEKIFKDALKNGSYKDYFTDNFAGDFGHCTRKGNRLLAENIANAILKEL